MIRHTMYHLLAGVAFGLAFIAPSSAPAAAEELTVYTAVEAEDLQRYAETFNKAHPDIKIKWVRDSTGIITAKLLAEKNNPQADVIWGLAATSLLLLKTEGMLEPYAPKGVEKLDKKFVDKSTPPTWIGMDAWVASICFNTVEAEKAGLPAAEVLEGPHQAGLQGPRDHAEPELLGHRLPRCVELAADVGRGGGLGVHGRAAREHRPLHPFRLQALQDGGCRRDRDRHLLRLPRRQVKDRGRADRHHRAGRGRGLGHGGDRHRRRHRASWKPPRPWSTGRSPRTANEMYNVGYAVVAIPGVAKPVENFPADLLEKMIDNDFEWAANNRAPDPRGVAEALRLQVRAQGLSRLARMLRTERPAGRR